MAGDTIPKTAALQDSASASGTAIEHVAAQLQTPHNPKDYTDRRALKSPTTHMRACVVVGTACDWLAAPTTITLLSAAFCMLHGS